MFLKKRVFRIIAQISKMTYFVATIGIIKQSFIYFYSM